PRADRRALGALPPPTAGDGTMNMPRGFVPSGDRIMNATITNSKTRKSLAEQIDRLDGILDGLSEGLNHTVAAAVAEATAAAVRLALVEVLGNPDVLALVGAAARGNAPCGIDDRAASPA